MKVIHSRKYIYNDKWANDINVLLVWFLSAIMWKHFGYDMCLYIDKHNLKLLSKYHIEELYDEINTSYFHSYKTFKNVNMQLFWALPKLKSFYHELIELGNDCVACDTDVVPIKDLKHMWTNAELVVWSNNEFKEMKNIYPDKKNLSTPRKYTYPEWVKFNAQPLNTGIIHFRRKEIAEEYLKEVFRFAYKNKNKLKNTSVQTMCVAEQLFIGNYALNKGISYTCIQPLKHSVFNRNAFHTHSYKAFLTIDTDLAQLWSIDLLLMIKKFRPEYFEKLIVLEDFKVQKVYFDTYGYTWAPVPELDRYIDELDLTEFVAKEE